MGDIIEKTAICESCRTHNSGIPLMTKEFCCTSCHVVQNTKFFYHDNIAENGVAVNFSDMNEIDITNCKTVKCGCCNVKLATIPDISKLMWCVDCQVWSYDFDHIINIDCTYRYRYGPEEGILPIEMVGSETLTRMFRDFNSYIRINADVRPPENVSAPTDIGTPTENAENVYNRFVGALINNYDRNLDNTDTLGGDYDGDVQEIHTPNDLPEDETIGLDMADEFPYDIIRPRSNKPKDDIQKDIDDIFDNI